MSLQRQCGVVVRQPDRSPHPQAGGARSSGRASVSSSVKSGNIRTCARCSRVLGPGWGRFRPAAVVLGDKALGMQHAGPLSLPVLSQLRALTPAPTPTPHIRPQRAQRVLLVAPRGWERGPLWCPAWPPAAHLPCSHHLLWSRGGDPSPSSPWEKHRPGWQV